MKSWDIVLCKAEFAHNHEIKRSTGYCPFCVVYGLVPRSQVDVGVASDLTCDNAQAVDHVGSLTQLHIQVDDNLQVYAAKYKKMANRHRRDLQFKVGDQVWDGLTKERFSPCSYNKLKARKISLLDILENVNVNTYCVLIPSDVRCSDVFNIKHLVPYTPNDDVEDSRQNLFLPRVT